MTEHRSWVSALVVPVACFFAGYLSHLFMTQPLPQPKFHIDATLACLKKEKSPVTQTSSWINLGFWTRDDLTSITSFPEACEMLALKLGRAVGLSANDVVLDAGIGRGDQCVLWAKHFGVAKVVGLDVTPTHLAGADALVKSLDLSGTISVLEGSATSLDHLRNHAFTKVVSCDAAYHFNTRATFVREAFEVLLPNGEIGVVDCAVAPELLTWKGFEQARLRAMCSMASIPFANLWTIDMFAEKFKATGFSDVKVTPLEGIMTGFGAFTEAHGRILEDWGLAEGFEKFRMTGQMLLHLHELKYLTFVLVTARK
ncbi:methyltransferase [Achlya hypogyna]|uniref:Methyltransferase n=1 Tax=Achlya hypogyna TaxID=1202772 RepID=A0A1V9Z828_ACHHY|nr:methyltransferase [Achlya hypogyna]